MKFDLALYPVTVSQVSAPAVLGITGRKFRETVVANGIPHTRLGKTVIVRIDVWLAAMDRLSTSTAPDADTGDAPMTVDDMLRRIGRRRTA